MAQKIVVITGCSSGIGLAAAALLANHESKRYKVYATLRNLSKKEGLEKAIGDNLNNTAFIREMDVNKDESVAKVFSMVLEEEGRVEVLINNAGILADGVIEAMPVGLFRQVLETNYLGLVRTIQAIIPSMKERRSGRIINISSDSGIIGTPFLDAYVAAKFAVEGLSQCLAAVLRNFNVHVSTIQYGPVHTSIWENSISTPAEPQMSHLDDLTQELFAKYREAMRKIYVDHGITPEEAVKIIVDIIEEEQPKLMYQPQEWTVNYMSVNMTDTTGEATMKEIRKIFDTE
ncbi:retinol dehydrogenase 8-like [Glandiceps talaboti]